jgi:hypothetical protein
VEWDAVYCTFSRLMVGSLRKKTVCYAYPMQSNAIHSYDHITRRVKANLLDDGIGDTLVSVAATIARHDISGPTCLGSGMRGKHPTYRLFTGVWGA